MSGKERFVRRLFDRVSPRYDLFNRIASLGLDRGWRRRAIARLNLLPGMRMLDLAAGTGDLAIEAAVRLLPLGKAVACDLSHPMLAAAAEKLVRHPAAGWHVACVQARAEALPFGPGSFDAAAMGFALRNVSDLDATFRQMHRVLKPGGRIALLEFGRPAHPLLAVGHRLWLALVVPLVGFASAGRLWPFLYLRRSILAFMPPTEVIRRLEQAGFADTAATPLAAGAVFLYRARRP